MNKIRLDMVSDVVCPWCAIGYKRLEKAMQQLQGEIDFELVWHPFELNPQMAPEGENASEHLQHKYGLSAAALQHNREQLAATAAGLGLEFNYSEDRRIYNTFDAHRVLHWAGLQGKQLEFHLALFREYFTKGNNPSDAQVLTRVATELGLDASAVAAILHSDDYSAEVRAEQSQYTGLGIQAVPTFVINNRYMISGAQEPDTLVNAFRQVVAQTPA